MIFAGFGNKAKVRGEVFYPCFRCERMTTFALLETYNYGSLYGVRLAKVGTKRLFVCSFCQGSTALNRQQWEACREIANGLTARREITESDMRTCVFDVARRVFPGQAAMVAELMGGSLEPTLPPPPPRRELPRPRRELPPGEVAGDVAGWAEDWARGGPRTPEAPAQAASSHLPDVDAPVGWARTAQDAAAGRSATLDAAIPCPPRPIPPPPAPIPAPPTVASSTADVDDDAPGEPEDGEAAEGNQPGNATGLDPAVELLRERLARGEIDVVAYRELLEALEETAVP